MTGKTNTDHLDEVGLLEKIQDLTGEPEGRLNLLSPREIVRILEGEKIDVLIDLYERLNRPDKDKRLKINVVLWPFLRNLVVDYCNRNHISMQKLVEFAIMRFIDHQGYYLEVMSTTHPLFNIFLDALWEISTVEGKIIPTEGLENTERVLQEMAKTALIDVEKSLYYFRNNGMSRDTDILNFKKDRKALFGHAKKYRTRIERKGRTIISDGQKLERHILSMSRTTTWRNIVYLILHIQNEYFKGEDCKLYHRENK